MSPTSRRVRLSVLPLLALIPALAAGALLPSSPEMYVAQADAVRQSQDRPWAPETGQLGNLRHLQITAHDCVVRVVSGNENRVFAGSRDVIVVERSRVFDADPRQQPTPRDVVLAMDHAQACPGPGRCGISITPAARAPRLDGNVCFTVQLASAHDLLLGGDGLDVILDRVQQPALRITFNPGARQRLWAEHVDIGLLSISANAAVRVGGTGNIDFLQATSSNGASAMFLHGFDAKNIGISSTTTGTQWSIRIGEDTRAGYAQPASAGGTAVAGYPIEIDGPLERLDIPLGQVDPRPLRDATRNAAQVLRDELLQRAGASPRLPASDSNLLSAVDAAAILPRTPAEHVARVLVRYLPTSVKITHVALWKRGGRLEATAPDQATVQDAQRRLKASGEFTHVSGGSGSPRDGAYAFTAQMHFSCEVPGEPSICRAGDPRARGNYSEMQLIETLEQLLAPHATLHDARLDGRKIHMDARAANEADARAALALLYTASDFFRVSISGVGPSDDGSGWEITTRMELLCVRPPTATGICPAKGTSTRGIMLDGPE